DIGRRARGCSLGPGSLRLRVNARGALQGKEPFEAFQIVRQAINRRRHACEWSTDRVIRDLGIDQMSQNVTGSSRRFGPPCALRVPPIDALKHVSELGRCNHNNALGWRGPDELTALKPLGIKRHAESIVPKHFYQIAPAAAKHKEIAGMRIALQCFLYLKSKAIHAAAHIGTPGRNPHAYTRGNGYHRRGSAFITAV